MQNNFLTKFTLFFLVLFVLSAFWWGTDNVSVPDAGSEVFISHFTRVSQSISQLSRDMLANAERISEAFDSIGVFYQRIPDSFDQNVLQGILDTVRALAATVVNLSYALLLLLEFFFDIFADIIIIIYEFIDFFNIFHSPA